MYVEIVNILTFLWPAVNVGLEIFKMYALIFYLKLNLDHHGSFKVYYLTWNRRFFCHLCNFAFFGVLLVFLFVNREKRSEAGEIVD